MTITIEQNPFELPPAFAELRSEARSVAHDFAGSAAEIRRHLLEHSEIHPQLWSAFRDRGWPGLALPTDGEGDLLGLTLVLEAFAEQGITLWMPVLSTAVAYAITQVGPESSRHWSHQVADGSAQLGMAATEPESGHNLFRAETEIRREDDHFIVNGRKRVTSGLDVVDRVLVFGRIPATEGRGYTTVLVDPRTPGTTITELPMHHREGVKQFELELRDVVVPAADLVGTETLGLLTMWPFTHVERVLTAALCLGTAAHSINHAVMRAKNRTIDGHHPIGANQAIAHPLADLHARLQATRLLVYRTATRFHAGTDRNVVAADANTAKLLASELAFAAADHTVQVMGADAWDERSGWLDNYLDARLSRSGPVSNEFTRNFIAQHVLGLPAHK